MKLGRHWRNYHKHQAGWSAQILKVAMTICSHCSHYSNLQLTPCLQVYVHTPKSLGSSPGKRTAILYAHGGGAISGTADMYQPLTAALAVETGGPQYLSTCVEFSTP